MSAELKIHEPQAIVERPTRNDAISRIKDALRARSGKAWSVKGGRGTAYGWISIYAPPKRCTWDILKVERDPYDDSPAWYWRNGLEPGKGHMGPDDRDQLAELLGLDSIHYQGHNIPASGAYYQEYVDRAEGREPSVVGERYWD